MSWAIVLRHWNLVLFQWEKVVNLPEKNRWCRRIDEDLFDGTDFQNEFLCLAGHRGELWMLTLLTKVDSLGKLA